MKAISLSYEHQKAIKIFVFLATSILLSNQSSAGKPSPVINWVAFDIPPMEIAYGPEKGNGGLDKIRNRIIQELPQYKHKEAIPVNQDRFFRLLSRGTFCNIAMRPTLKFEESAIQSIPHFTGFSDVIISTEQHREELTKFGTPVPLQRILSEGKLKLGIPSRSMGEKLDDILKKYGNSSNMLTRNSSQVGRDLLHMLLKGRIDYTIGFPSAKRSWENHPDTVDLISIPIQGLHELVPIGHITCSNNQLGRKFIADSNKAIRKLLNDPIYIEDFILGAYPAELKDAIQERIEMHIKPVHDRYLLEPRSGN